MVVGQVVVHEDEDDGGEELDGENFDFRKRPEDEQVGELRQNAEDDDGIGKVFGEYEENVESDGDLGGSFDDFLRFL